ncbi:MAG: lytic transglycosylase domain-containing protein [Ignavibacteriales bacterium]|nr:lytic transglycosylase domain-containing protein [Ignavibacteriales bacterium]
MENKKYNSTILLSNALFIIGIGTLILFASFRSSDISKVVNYNLNYYQIYSPVIPDTISFCGESVPLNNFDVRERLDKELIVNMYRHSATIQYLKRAARWFPLFEEILKEKKVPEDFKYVAVIESELQNVISPAGATGFWQFMEGAALKYGLEVEDEVDERYNIEKSTYAACDYLIDAYNKLDSWTLSAASYNMGVGGIKEKMNKQQTKNYYNLWLNQETSRYIFRILAIKIIFENPEKYGFYMKENDLYPPLETFGIEIDYSIEDLPAFAKKMGVSYRMLKLLNPWLRKDELKNKYSRTYKIKLPKIGTVEEIPDNHY